MKTCTKCHEEKPLDHYHNMQASPDGHAWQCKRCTLREKNVYDARKEVREHKRKYNANRREEKREQISKQRAEYRAKNADSVKQRKADYYQRNPHINWGNSYRVRCKQYGLEPDIHPFTREDLIARHGDACVDCGGRWTGVDHVIPVIFGGSHSLDNCEPVCIGCNLRRWQKVKQDMFEVAQKIYTGEAA